MRVISFLSAFFLLCSCVHTNPKVEQILSETDSLYRTGAYSDAVRPAMEALELAREDNDYYLCGRAEDLIADIIATTYGGREVVEHRLNAADYYQRADSLRAHRYALLDVAIAHANNDTLRLSTLLIDSLRTIAGSDSALLANCFRAKMRISLKTQGVTLCDDLNRYHRFFTPDATDYACLAISESQKENEATKIEKIDPEYAAKIRATAKDYQLYLDSARSIASTEHEQKLIDWATAECYKNTGDIERWRQLKDSLNDAYLFSSPNPQPEEVAGAQRDFQSDLAAEHKIRASHLRNALLTVCLIFLLLAAMGYVYYRLRMKAKNAEIEAQMESLANLSKDIANGSTTAPDLSGRIENLFRERWQTINFLCNEFFEKGDSEKTRAVILNEVEKEIERMKTPRNLRQIEASVDDCMDQIVSRLRSQCGDTLKEEGIVFLTLIYAGFSPRAVCMFTGIKLKSFYTKRTRLIARISASDAPDRSDFLQRLNVRI